MIWVSILAILVLCFSFIGGFKEGAVKHFFSLIALIVAIPLAGVSYRLLAKILSFLPGENWENFIGFFITMGIISVIFHLAVLPPRKLIQKMWGRGILYRIIGGGLNVINASVGMVVFALVIRVHPILGWLERAVTGSGVLNRLIADLGFVQALLPEVFRL